MSLCFIGAANQYLAKSNGRRSCVAISIERQCWLGAIYDVVVATHVYGLQVRAAYPGFVTARVRVGTLIYAAVSSS